MTDKPIVIINVRLPADLKWRIAVAAAENRRSVNSEIVYQLEAFYGADASESGAAA